MLLAVALLRCEVFELAVLAAKVLFVSALSLELLLAVDHAAEVRLFAVVALVERVGLHCEAEQIVLKLVAGGH